MEQEFNQQSEKQIEASSSANDWKQKIRFDRSFYAKIALADKSIKQAYAALATAILRYDRTRSRLSWSGVNFAAGRETIAAIALSGKTLLLYLALPPEELVQGRYKPKNVASVKKRAKTPALFRIKSRGALANALKMIDKLAERIGLSFRDTGEIAAPAVSFKADSFNNLVSRGFIRVVKTDVKPIVRHIDGVFGALNGSAVPVDGVSVSVQAQENSAGGAETTGKEENETKNAQNAARNEEPYQDTLNSSDRLLSAHGVYSEILSALASGEGKVRLSEKLMLRSIDEMWVSAIERSLPALDELIRKPARYIAEAEEVLPIELTKRVSGRSLTHLARHTDYISKNENGDVTPTKLLNVFREDSILTYENKFVNTLISRLYLFIGKRAKIAEEAGADEVLNTFEFENSFEHGGGKGTVKISVEYSERNTEETTVKPFLGTGLWARVQRLDGIVSGYMRSSFVKAMDRNFIRPPVLRTNAILKNKYFRECLALWEFIESYEDAGYGITVRETVKNVSDEYINEIYALAAQNYLVFLHNVGKPVKNAEEYEYTVSPEVVTNVKKPVRDMSQGEYTERFEGVEFDFSGFSAEKTSGAEELKTVAAAAANVAEPTEKSGAESETTAVEQARSELDFALETALVADEIAEPREEKFVSARYVRTFHARIRAVPYEQKQRYAHLANEFLAFRKVKLRESKRFASFRFGRVTIARVAVSGKTLKVYFADPDGVVQPNEVATTSVIAPENAFSVTEEPRFTDTPVCVRVRGNGGEKRAVSLIHRLAERYKLKLAENPPQIAADDYPLLSLEEMIAKGWVSIVEKEERNFKENSSFFFGNIGPTASPHTLAEAEEVRKNAVEESSTALLASELPDSTPETPSPESVVFSSAKTLEQMVRTQSNYETPTECGLDDSSGFIEDELQSAKAKEDSEAHGEQEE